MSSADWTSISNGSSFAIVADGTAPSGPDVMQITGSGGQDFQNITAGPFKNSGVSCWSRISADGSTNSKLMLRSLNTNTIATATFFQLRIFPLNTTTIRYRVLAVVAGTQTIIVQSDLSSLNGNPSNTWQQYKFLSFNSGTDILLRASQWNGSVFVPVVDCAAPIASFPTLDASGSCRFGADPSGPAIVYTDDVNYYSLT